MRVAEIPFVELVGIKENEHGLWLDMDASLLNHIGTLHASAQFTLAESESGRYLQKLFPELEGEVVPLLRESTSKYKKPASKSVSALASLEDGERERFLTQFSKRGRGSIKVSVEVVDSDGICTMEATFSWFVQKI